MQPHEQRVVDERNELGEKLAKLNDFFATQIFRNLSDVEKSLLLGQKDAMTCYLNILQRRIDVFSGGLAA